MNDPRLCRLSGNTDEIELAGPPAALRALAHLLRHAPAPAEVPITGGTVTQEVTSGPLLVALPDPNTLRFSGGHACLGIVWDTLDSVAEQAETSDERTVNRHQHIEHLHEDQYRSPDSVPLVIVADCSDEPTPR